jgi:hypothetical protein
MKKQIVTKGITSLEARIKNRPFIPILIVYEIQIEQRALKPCQDIDIHHRLKRHMGRQGSALDRKVASSNPRAYKVQICRSAPE